MLGTEQFLSVPLFFRVPLRKGKSMRQSLKEHGKLQDYLKNHPRNLGSKYFPNIISEDATEPMTNYMDVSMAKLYGCTIQPLLPAIGSKWQTRTASHVGMEVA